jgi:hypothetical protein
MQSISSFWAPNIPKYNQFDNEFSHIRYLSPQTPKPVPKISSPPTGHSLSEEHRRVDWAGAAPPIAAASEI